MEPTDIIFHKEEQNLCRTCLAESTELRSIYKAGKICGHITKLADMLTSCTNIEFSNEDGLPGQICSKCVMHISKAYAFIQLCIKSDGILRNQLTIDKEQQSLLEDLADNKSIDVKKLEDQKSKSNLKSFNVYSIGTFDNDEQQEELELDGEKVSTRDQNDQQALDTRAQQGSYVTCKEELDHQNQVDILYETEVLEYEPDELEESMLDDLEEDRDVEEYVLLTEDDQMSEEILDDRMDMKFENADNESANDQSIKPTKETKRPSTRGKRVRVRSDRPIGPPFQCIECQKVLSNYNSYKYHMQLHSDKTPFLCSQCGAGFKTPNAYEGHMITHADVNPHTCNVCSKSYRQAASLRAHMLSHSGLKPFVCQICGKGMTQKSGYKKHMLIHSGEKPHQCDVCLKFFRYSSNLIMHKRSHTNEKPHECDVCGKGFISTEQLKRHKLIHTGDKPYSCDICGKAFNRKSTLQVHLTTHSGSRTHVCPICQKSYSQRENLSSHMSSQHHGEYVETQSDLGEVGEDDPPYETLEIDDEQILP